MFVQSGSIQLFYETFGNRNSPAVLLHMGNSCDATMWPDSFCEELADKGMYVIRFDQRDTGLSTWVDFSENPYTLLDMAQDVISLLDALNIKRVSLVGYSTGGLVAQLCAIHFPDRLNSLILMMTSPDLTIKNDAFAGLDVSHKGLSPPKKVFIEEFFSLRSMPQISFEEKISFLVEIFRLANGSSYFDEAFFFNLFAKSLGRVKGHLRNGGHESNHALATSATPVILESEFKEIKVPTLIISGEQDPIFPSDHGVRLHELIPQSTFFLIQDMGHVLNPIFFERIVSAFAFHILPEETPSCP